MLIRVHPAPMYATNCWVLAAEKGSECIIVDPGMPDISAEIEMIIEEEGLKPVAVLITHGHLDHTFSVIPLADGYGIRLTSIAKIAKRCSIQNCSLEKNLHLR